MPTSYMKLPYEDRVLQHDSLHPMVLEAGAVGYSLDVLLNYYRGMPLSAIERLELTVDGERVPEHLILLEYERKLIPLSEVRLASSEFWAIKKPLKIRIYGPGLGAGAHEVDLTLILRVVYMQFAPGVWGMLDNSSSRKLTIQEP